MCMVNTGIIIKIDALITVVVLANLVREFDSAERGIILADSAVI